MTPDKTNGASRPRSAAQQDLTPTSHQASTSPSSPRSADPEAIQRTYRRLLEQAGGRVPFVGTPEWCALDPRDPRKSAAVVYAALDWARQNTLAAQEERAEVDEYFDRSALKQAALVMSAMWQERHEFQESYAELERRRRLVSILPCAYSQCGTEVEFIHPLSDDQAARLPDLSWVRCPAHAGRDRLEVAA